MKKLWLILLFILPSIYIYAQCDVKIDLDIIKIIESSGDSLAINLTDGGSRGLYQIAPICLRGYNKKTNHSYSLNDLFKVKVNTEIARWMIDVEIPHLLKACRLPNTLENQIICYNAGISFLYKKWKIPQSTKNYIKRYKRLCKLKK